MYEASANDSMPIFLRISATVTVRVPLPTSTLKLADAQVPISSIDAPNPMSVSYTHLNIADRNSGFKNLVITDSSGNIVYEYEDIQGMKESFFGFEELEGYSEGSTKISKIYMNNEDYETRCV